MSYLRWFLLTTSLTLGFTATGVWLEARLQGEPAALAKATAQTGPSQVIQATIQVLITGAVQKPGLYRLPAGSKLRDLMALAGGATPTVRLSSLNFERTLNPGEVILVPANQLQPASTADAPAPPPASESRHRTSAPVSHLPSPGPINLNRATLSDLDRLPGVGPALAQRILDWRKAHGGFRKTEDLQQVKGIGPKKFEKLQGLLTV